MRMTKCKICGKAISDFVIVCPNCGAENNCLNCNNQTERKLECTKKNSITLIILACIFALSVILAIASYYAMKWRGTWGIGIVFKEIVRLYGVAPIRLIFKISIGAVIASITVITVYAVKKYKEKSGL